MKSIIFSLGRARPKFLAFFLHLHHIPAGVKLGPLPEQGWRILFGFQIKCSILFGEPQAGKSPPAPHKTCGFGACLAGAMP
ncbi:MAG: hypothetical protein LBU06_10240, partial [Desulfovibrio sp.]|nr:hypothetical protein [Desulfovibrio sp.]